MRIERIDVFSYPVPFKAVFRHASASRAYAENLIVAVRADSGETGYGEGCPRHYVTGETIESGVAFIREHADAVVGSVGDEQSLRAWADAHRGVIDVNPSAFCAVELGVLDLLGKIRGVPVEDLVGAPRLDGGFTYSAVLGDAPYPAYWWQVRRYWKEGFRDFKVKVSGDAGRDHRKLRLLAKKPQLRMRLDANNLWESADDCIRHINALPSRVLAIEEPLRAGDLEGFAEVGAACDTHIILDESVSRAGQVESLDDSGRWFVNIRVSKMGGLHRSLEVAERAASRGIGVIVGAQVGETSILTRAGLTVMQAVGSNLVASEGAFGTHLLREDLVPRSLMFGGGGVLTWEDSAAPGLGLDASERGLVRA